MTTSLICYHIYYIFTNGSIDIIISISHGLCFSLICFVDDRFAPDSGSQRDLG